MTPPPQPILKKTPKKQPTLRFVHIYPTLWLSSILLREVLKYLLQRDTIIKSDTSIAALLGITKPRYQKAAQDE